MGKGSNSTGRRRRLLRWVWAGASALALAAVILGVSAVSRPRTASLPEARLAGVEAERLADQGLAALSRGETSTAVPLLRRAAAAGDERAKRALDRIARRTPRPVTRRDEPAAPDPTPPSTPPVVPPKTDEEYLKALGDLRVLLPSAVEGYEFGAPEGVTPVTVMPVDATPSGPYRRLSRAVVSVHDRGTASAASAFVSGVSKTAYPDDAASVTVGSRTAYFGTDGQHLATVSFARGRYAFEVIVTASNEAPEDVRDIALQLAAAFPAAK